MGAIQRKHRHAYVLLLLLLLVCSARYHHCIIHHRGLFSLLLLLRVLTHNDRATPQGTSGYLGNKVLWTHTGVADHWKQLAPSPGGPLLGKAVPSITRGASVPRFLSTTW